MQGKIKIIHILEGCGSLVPTDSLEYANLGGKFSVILHRNLLKTGRLSARFLLHLTKNFLANLHIPSESPGTERALNTPPAERGAAAQRALCTRKNPESAPGAPFCRPCPARAARRRRVLRAEKRSGRLLPAAEKRSIVIGLSRFYSPPGCNRCGRSLRRTRSRRCTRRSSRSCRLCYRWPTR